jgi:hypothetical protein
VLLALALIGPVWADDDNNKKPVETSNEVDCEDRDNAALPECQSLTPPIVVTEQAPPSTSTESAPAATAVPVDTGSGLYQGPARDIVFKLADAGKEATQMQFEDGMDTRGAWARGRYERRDDSGSSDSLGPRVIDHTVYVTKTVDQAKQLFKDEVAKNEKFPEQNSRDERRGFFKFDIKNIVEQTAAVSACNDCNGKDQILLHHRVVQQRDNIVSVLYLYGRDKRGAEEITTQKRVEELWAYEVSLRI